MNWIDTSQEIQMTNKDMKKCAVSLVISERLINGILEYHLTPGRKPVSNAGQDVEKKE